MNANEVGEKFEQFCIVELFGHQIIAGLVSEQVIGGQSFVRVDVPKNGDAQGFTKFYGPGAIYCLTPCDESTLQAAVEGIRAKPIEEYKLNLRRPELLECDEDTEDMVPQIEKDDVPF